LRHAEQWQEPIAVRSARTQNPSGVQPLQYEWLAIVPMQHMRLLNEVMRGKMPPLNGCGMKK